MRIREATLDDKSAWDSFVDSEGGSFFHYFDWKHVHEAGGRQFIPLLIETASSQLLGLLPVIKRNWLLHSTLDSATAAGVEGLVLKRGLSDNERLEATSALLEHVDEQYSRRCSSFRVTETTVPVSSLSEEPTAALVHSGFHFRYDRATHLPCNFVLELERPFVDNVWKGWSKTLRRQVDKAEEDGVVVIQDRELKYANDFIEMLWENYRRHRTEPPTRDEITARLNVFREKSKLFVALLDGQPIMVSLNHYTPSTCYLAKVGSYEKDTDSANKLCWKVAIEDACNTGYRFADLGYTATSSLAVFKERFKGTRVPVRTYEKRYSVPRTLLEKAPIVTSGVWHDRSYIWRNRRKIWDRVVHI